MSLPTRFRRTQLAALACALSLGIAACGGKSDTELIASAKSLLDTKDTKGAVIQLKSAIQQNPQSGEARFLLGKTLLAGGDPVAALVELRKAQELQVADELVIPEIARAMLSVGEEGKLIPQYGSARLKTATAQADLRTSISVAHALRNEMELADEAVASALQAQPGYAPAAIQQARLRAASGAIDNALELLAQVLQKEPTNDAAGLLQGELLWHGKNDIAKATEAIRKVAASNPESVRAHASLITLLNESKKPDEAKAQFELLKKVAPNHPETLFFEAQFAFSKQDYKLTRDITDRLLKGMPENAQVLELAGAAEFRLRNYVAAEAFLGRALKTSPNLLLSRQLLAQVYLRTNQPTKTLEVLAPLLEGKNVDGASLALAADAWMQTGDTKRSEAAFAQAAKIAPNDARVRTSAALAQLARGNSSAALGQLEAIAAEDKGPRADVALISARLKLNDIPGALKAIEGLERKTPDRPLAYNLKGRVLLLKRDLEGAKSAFETALSKDPGYFPAIASLAAMELSAGKPELARKRFEEVTKARPKAHEAWLAMAELDARTGAPPEQVLGHLRSAVKANAGEAAPHLALIKNLLGAGDYKSALTAAREASAALPSNLEIMAALGRTQVAAENAEQAVSTFKQLTALQPTNPAHHYSMAEALMAHKDSEGARRSLRKALEIQPDFTPAKQALVKLSLIEKRPQEGLAIAKDMQKQSPLNPTGFILEGDVELSRKNFDAATAAYKQAFQLAKTTENFVRVHGALRQGGKTAEAERLTADWSKARPKDAGLRYYLGDLALSQNEFAAAEGHYRTVLELQPNNALAMNNIAWLLAKQGKPGAVAMAEKANELMPGKVALMDTLATALASENKLPKAIDVQKSAIARSPNDPGLKLGLAKLLIKSGDKAYARSELEDLAKMGDKFKGQAEVSALLKSL